MAALMARHSTRQMVYERGMGITIVELQLAAALYEELRPVIREWGRAYAQIVRKTLLALGSADPYADAALLMNTISGLVLGQLALPNGDFENGNVRPTLLRLLHLIRGEPARDVSHQA
ncbi:MULTISPECIES: hypothetical protein [Streptomyces]|uniref:Tetracyclin repressor-like C-terminal group 31 domain-containing protein n=2 Tax=Streptomyces TaxID=1883 RepID=A0ABV9JBH3_9ACTN